jgi:sigma-B regulation protein RsbU (phosphoserine phosphatase)
MDQQTIESPEFQVSRGVVDRVFREGQPLLTSNAQEDSRLDGRASIVALGLRSILCVPLRHKGTNLGVIYVDNRLRAGIFTQDDLELLGAIASSAVIAIENARLYEVAVEKGRMERELQVAREVQSSLIPRGVPKIQGWELAARWVPAREVSGDFYDFIPVELAGSESHRSRGGLGIVIADVSDKGMPAALFMALTRSIVRASVAQGFSPAEGITKANKLVCADAADGMFVTLFYAQLDSLTNDLVYVNAGHDPPLLYRAKDERLISLGRTGMALGIDEDTRFEQRIVQFEPGDFVFLYTDGVTDAANAQWQAFERVRVEGVIQDSRALTMVELILRIESALSEFVGDSPAFDDITMLAMKRL